MYCIVLYSVVYLVYGTVWYLHTQMIDPIKQSNVSIVLRKKSNQIVIFLTREGGLTSFESVSLILRQSSFVECTPHSDLLHLDITSAADAKVTAKVTAKVKAGAIGIFRLEYLSAYQNPVIPLLECPSLTAPCCTITSHKKAL